MLFRSDQPKRRRSRAVQALERRQFLSAHVAGDSTVYSTIQAAVDAAAAGSIITVDAGTYAELVTVNKSLTIRGAQVDVDGRSNLRTNAATESTVSGQFFGDGTHSTAFYIIANDVTIDGFTVTGNTASTYGAGIVIAPGFSGTHIVNDVIENNIAGLYLANASATDGALIQHNLFYNNNQTGAENGRAIYSDGSVSGGNLTNVTIDGNMFTHNLGPGNIEAAIGLEALSSSQSNITISNNVFDFNGKAVLAYNVNGMTITGNVVVWSRDYTSGALRFEGGDSNVTISNNLIYDDEAIGIHLDLKAVPTHNSNFTITHNNIYGNGQGASHQGLEVDAATYDGSLNATNNYWGASTGPSGDGTGTGDAVLAHLNSVIFSGWATSAFTPLQSPYYGVAWDPTAPIEAENFDNGGANIAYSDNSTSNLEQELRPYESVDIEKSTDTDSDGGYDVTEVHSTEYMNYTVNVPTTGTYTLNVRFAAGEATAGTFHIAVDGTNNVAGQWTLAGTTGDQVWTTQTRAGYVLPAGLHVITFAVDSSGSSGYFGNINWFKFVWAGPAAPTNLTAAPNGSKINLAWTDNTANETAFVVERKSNPGGAWQTLTTTAANATSANDPAFAGGTTYFYRVHALTPSGDSAYSNVVQVITPSSLAVDYAGHAPLPFVNDTNGFGPEELDQSNGGSMAHDGATITLNGVAYSRGIGAHANSSIDLQLNGNYTRFLSDIGVDDEETSDSSIVFQVWNGVTKLFDSGTMRPTSTTQSINLDVTGIQTLTLKITDAGDGAGFDHGDWAGARFVRAGAAVATVYNGTSGADAYLVREDATTQSQLEIVQNGTVLWTVAKSAASKLQFNLGSGDDTLTTDYTNGSPIPTGGIFFDGGAGNDALIVNGSPNADVVTVANALAGPTAGNIDIGDATAGTQTVENVTFNGGVGNDTLTIASGPVAGLTFNGGLTSTDQDTLNLNAGACTFNSDANLATANLTLNVNNAGTSVQFMTTQHLAGLSIANANVTLAADGTRVINTGTLAVTGTGKLDLSDNDMVVTAGTLGTWNGTGVTRSIADGYHNGTWTGNGIITSQFQTLALRARTTLGVAQASAVLNFGSGSTAVFDGQTVTGSAILVKYTYMGDANLSGQLDGDDYFKIDSGFAGRQNGFARGDFDYSGTVNADDYFWLDSNYSAQPSKL